MTFLLYFSLPFTSHPLLPLMQIFWEHTAHFFCFLGHWNLSFLTGDWTCTFRQWNHRVLTTGLPGNFWETHPFKKKGVVKKKKKREREGCGGWQFGSWNTKKDHTIHSGGWLYFWTTFTRGIMLLSSEENLERLEEEAITSPPHPSSPISWHEAKTQLMI